MEDKCEMESRMHQQVKWIGITLTLLMGVIHLYMAPGEMADAPYLAVLFVAAGLGSVFAAVGIYRYDMIWYGGGV